MRQRLTAPFIKQLKPKAKAYSISDSEIQGLSVRVEPSGTKTYYLRYRNEAGVRKSLRIGQGGILHPPEARKIARERLGQVANGEDPAHSKQLKKSNADTLQGFIEHVYCPWVVSNQKSGKATVKRINSAFKSLLNKKLNELSPFLFEKHRKATIENGIKPSTVNRNIAALSGALARAVEWNYLESNPLTTLRPLSVDEKPVDRYLHPDERERLYSALRARNARHRAERATANQWREQRGYNALPDLNHERFTDHLEPMILLSLNTGLRRGELFSLRWSEVDLVRRILSVRNSTSKSGKTRHIPLNQEASGVLSDWKRQSGADSLVFTSKNGSRFDNVSSSWRQLMKDADIKDFRWHDMRHDFASQLVMRGVDLNTVRELLGHSDIKMTLRYAHLAPEHKMNAVETLCNNKAQTEQQKTLLKKA